MGCKRSSVERDCALARCSSTAAVAERQFILRSIIMAGWKPYLDLVKKGDGVKCAGIYGQDGSTWSADAELKITAGEVKDIVAGIKGTNFPQTGIIAGGVKHMFLKKLGDNNNCAIGRKVSTSIIVRLSKKALIVLLTKDGANPANITSHDFVADDLSKKGF